MTEHILAPDILSILRDHCATLAGSEYVPILLADPTLLVQGGTAGATTDRAFVAGKAVPFEVRKRGAAGDLELVGLPSDWTVHGVLAATLVTVPRQELVYRHAGTGHIGTLRQAAAPPGRKPRRLTDLGATPDLRCGWDPGVLIREGFFWFQVEAAVPAGTEPVVVLELDVQGHDPCRRQVSLAMLGREDWGYGTTKVGPYPRTVADHPWSLRLRSPKASDWLDGTMRQGPGGETLDPLAASPCEQDGDRYAFRHLALEKVGPDTYFFLRVHREAAVPSVPKPEGTSGAVVSGMLEKYGPTLLGFLSRMLRRDRDDPDVLDLYQETWTTLLGEFAQGKEVLHLAGLLRKIATNAYLQKLRREGGRGKVRRKTHSLAVMEEAEPASEVTDRVDLLAGLEDLFLRILADLDGLDREVCSRWLIRGQSRVEIAAGLGMTNGQVQTQLNRVRDRLRTDEDLRALNDELQP